MLQLKYKRRVYKMLHMDEKQLKAINSKASKKKFNDHVLNNNVDKVNKMCAKGLDPNFHCQDSHTGGKAHYYLSVSLLCNFWSDGLCSFKLGCTKLTRFYRYIAIMNVPKAFLLSVLKTCLQKRYTYA